MNKYFTVILLSIVSQTALSQTLTVTGTVRDAADKQPLMGVLVSLPDNQYGTVTNAEGRFRLDIPQENARDILEFSLMGMISQKIPIAGKTQIDVLLEHDNTVLEDLIVVGYGSMKKRDISGAIAQVKGDDLLRGNPAASINQALQGKMAGVNVAQNDGAPGAGITITVRGANSFNTSTQPLYVIDGIPFDVAGMPSGGDGNSDNNQTANPLALINPNNIESIEVLKDASATAIYGSRGANGVVLITTKKGNSSGAERIELNANFGIAKIGKRIEALGGYDYANYRNEQTINDQLYYGVPYTTLPYSGQWAYNYTADGAAIPSTYRYTPSPDDFLHPYIIYDNYGNQYRPEETNWQDQIYQTGASQEYNLRVSGGDARGWHSFSGNYMNQSGIIVSSGYERYNLAANIGRKVHDWIEMGMSISYTNSQTDFTKSNAYDYSIIRSALLFPPVYGLEMETSLADELSWLAANPYMYVHTAFDRLQTDNLFSSSYAEITFAPWLRFRQNLGLTYNGNSRMTYYGRHTQEGRAPNNGVGSQADNWWRGVTAESILTFDKTFGRHAINAVAGFTYEQGDWGAKTMVSKNFPSDDTGAYNMADGLEPQTPSSSRGRSNMVSFLARLNYVFKEKYIATASFRTDGTSKFAAGNKFAYFPAAALAWRISEEDFLKQLNIFSNLKLRLSYGQTGNQGIGSYETLLQYGSAKYPFDGQLSSGYAPVSWQGPPNPNLKWETTEQYNAGLDMSFLKNRLNFTIDYYHKNTRDLLQYVKIPSSSGNSQMRTNMGNVTNDGWELSGNFILVDQAADGFKWTADANISFNRNAIHGLQADQFATRLWSGVDEVFIQRNGLPIGAIFGFVEDGFYDSEAEVRADPQYATADQSTVLSMVGEIKYRDLSGPDGTPDGIIDNYDRTVIGNTNPDFTYGMTHNFSWHGFSFSFFLQGTQGNDMFNANLMDIEMANQGNITKTAYDTRWTPDNTANAQWPKATGRYQRVWRVSDRYVEDGSYLRLKNLSIGYLLPARIIKGVESIYIYASATNLLTITGYSWFDPDVNSFGGDASRRGVDVYSYPSSRNYSLGLKVGF